MISKQGSIRRNPTCRLHFAGLRRFPRKDFVAEVLVQDHEGWEVPVESLDFSPSGMFLRSNFLFEVGEVHNLIFRCPEGEEIFSVRAQVVRVENQPPATEEGGVEFIPGMAYEFLTHEATKKQRLMGLAARV